MDNLRMFIPLTKVDAEKRLVYGLATAETLDRSGEICDYASTKPYYEKWSGDISKASDGKSLGNLRAMHGKVAAGKVTSISFNDAAKQIEIAAKVVDDAEWRKVEEGVYTGFSQGGGYVKRWKGEDGLQRYTADPSEVSLVDLPCLASATFQMVKAAGVEEKRQFAESVRVPEPANEDVAKKAGELAKAAGRETEWSKFIDDARDELKKAALPAPPAMAVVGEVKPVEATPPAPGDGVEQVWQAKDGSTYAKKADALAKNAEIDASAGASKVLAALDDISGRLGIEKADGDWSVSSKNKNTTTHASKDAAISEAQSRDGNGDTNIVASGKDGKAVSWREDGGAKKTVTVESLTKGLYTVARFADLLASLRSLQVDETWQAAVRGDDANGSIAAIKSWVTSGCALLVTMIQEEANEIMPDLVDDDAYAVLAMAAGKMKPGEAGRLGKIIVDIEPLAKMGEALQKAGARNSKADQDKIQAMHDHACDLGAACSSDNCEGADKSAPSGDLAKALGAMTVGRDAEKARGDALQKTLDERIMPAIDLILKRVENIEKQPLPLPFGGGQMRAAKRVEDVGDITLSETLAKMQKDDPQGFALLMIKAAQSNPQPMGLR